MQRRVKSRRLNKGWAFLTQGAPLAAWWEGLFLAYVLDPGEELVLGPRRQVGCLPSFSCLPCGAWEPRPGPLAGMAWLPTSWGQSWSLMLALAFSGPGELPESGG